MSIKRVMPSGHRWLPASSYHEPLGNGTSLHRTEVIRCEGCGVSAFWSEHDARYYVDVNEHIYRDVLPSCAEERAQRRTDRGVTLDLVERSVAALRDVIVAVADGPFAELWDVAHDALHAVVDSAGRAIRAQTLAPLLLVDRDGASLVLDHRGLVHRGKAAEILVTEAHEIDGPSLGSIRVDDHVWFWGEIALALIARLKPGAHDVN